MDVTEVVRYGASVPNEDTASTDLDSLQCVVCDADEVVLVFDHDQIPGRRVAIPRRSGLCAACLLLIKEESFDRAANRASDVWDDFERFDLLQTLRDIARSVAPYKSARSGW